MNVRVTRCGGVRQTSAGTERQDGGEWGDESKEDSMGVDISQNGEVTGWDGTAGKINGIRKARGKIKTKKGGLCVAGSTNM